MSNSSDDDACRLCHATTVFAYQGTVLGKHRVSYFRCTECGSLQTEAPYWLAESYASAEQSIDPGAARRVLDSYILVDAISRLFSCRKLLDFGGNTGFLCRLLRDQGYDAYTFDRHVAAVYAPHFVGRTSDQHDLVSAFEVVEHFARPATELDEIFQPKPRIVLATTELYCGQSADWWYLAGREGQHVFFYSAQGARYVAEKYGYNLLVGRHFLLFTRSVPTFRQRQIVLRLIRPSLLRILGAILLVRRGRGAEDDFAALTRQGSAK